MTFVDSVFWIAVKYRKDKWHERAQELVSRVEGSSEIYIVEGIVVETVNFLLRKSSATIAIQVCNDLLDAKQIVLLENSELSRRGTRRIMEGYPQLSYTDANIVWHMQQKPDHELISFDSGFDGISGITRVG